MNRSAIRPLLKGIRNGQMLALAKSVSILENNLPPKTPLLKYLKSEKNQKSHGFSIAITGSAGSGKSTLIASLARLIRQSRKTVAIIAVDPTSPKTGGAFLGDRVRMQELAEDKGVFIRSMASRGASGGVAPATKSAVQLFLKAGYDFVLIETVGAGQLDYKATEITDLTILVLTPEAGDEMQFMKAGISELADVFVVNKADRPGAATMEDSLKRSKAGVPVFKTIAEQHKGISSLYKFILTNL